MREVEQTELNGRIFEMIEMMDAGNQLIMQYVKGLKDKQRIDVPLDVINILHCQNNMLWEIWSEIEDKI
jgi:hypothetical protein